MVTAGQIGDSMAGLASLQAVISGRVQGVYFRAFVARQAAALGLRGYVRNLPNGTAVEVRAEGEPEKLDKLLEHLKTGPPGAIVRDVQVKRGDDTGGYPDFRIGY